MCEVNTGAIVWWAGAIPDVGTAEGLINIDKNRMDYEVSKRCEVFGNFSRYIPVGSKRISAQYDTNRGYWVSGYKYGQSYTAVAVNPSDSEITVSLALDGASLAGAGDQRFHDMQPNSKLERNNITLNLNAKLDEHFSMKANVMYIRERAKNRSRLGDITDNANASLWQLAPNYGLADMKATNEDGTENEISASGFVVNPNFVVEKYKQSDAKDRVIGSIEAQYNFTPNWYLRGRAGGDMINRRAENGVPWGTALDPEGWISNNSEYHGEFNVEALAGYTNSFKEGLFNVNAFVG